MLLVVRMTAVNGSKYLILQTTYSIEHYLIVVRLNVFFKNNITNHQISTTLFAREICLENKNSNTSSMENPTNKLMTNRRHTDLIIQMILLADCSRLLLTNSSLQLVRNRYTNYQISTTLFTREICLKHKNSNTTGTPILTSSMGNPTKKLMTNRGHTDSIIQMILSAKRSRLLLTNLPLQLVRNRYTNQVN